MMGTWTFKPDSPQIYLVGFAFEDDLLKIFEDCRKITDPTLDSPREGCGRFVPSSYRFRWWIKRAIASIDKYLYRIYPDDYKIFTFLDGSLSSYMTRPPWIPCAPLPSLSYHQDFISEDIEGSQVVDEESTSETVGELRHRYRFGEARLLEVDVEGFISRATNKSRGGYRLKKGFKSSKGIPPVTIKGCLDPIYSSREILVPVLLFSNTVYSITFEVVKNSNVTFLKSVLRDKPLPRVYECK